MKRSLYLPETLCLTFLREKRKRETLKFITCYGNLLFLRDTWMKEDGQNIGTRRFHFHCFFFRCWLAGFLLKVENLKYFIEQKETM